MSQLRLCVEADLIGVHALGNRKTRQKSFRSANAKVCRWYLVSIVKLLRAYSTTQFFDSLENAYIENDKKEGMSLIPLE